ncbi:MAG: ACP S-malonyltransferase [Lachnospiraceae bacterium]
MGKTAYLFPGQGAQKAGMGKDFYEHSAAARTFFEEASEQLQMDLKTLCFTDNENLNQTAYTQPAMVTAELAIVEAMKEAGIFCPDAAAGLSLGEYSALAAAGVLAPMDAVRAVKSRGRLMEEAVPAGEGAMSAVLAMKPETVEEILGNLGEVWIANDNCPGQLVISGRTEAVERAEEALRRAGAKRVIRLKVSGPFHSPLLKKAGEALGTVLEPIPAARPEIPYVANVTGAYVREKEPVKELLIRQVSGQVRWRQSILMMLEDGVDTFVEIGPGKTLSAFVRKISREAVVRNLETWEDLLQWT